MKITVLTATYRDSERLLKQAQWLQEQTLDHHDFEWVVVDDKHAERPDLFEGHDYSITHLPPREFGEYSAPQTALNTGIAHARGKVVWFMADSVYPLQQVLARTWANYERWGPDIFMSGQAKNLHENRNATHMWDDSVGECTEIESLRRWYWTGYNDSAPLEALLKINGLDESYDGYLGGSDVITGIRLLKAGYKYVIDGWTGVERVFDHHHAKTMQDASGWQDHFWRIANGEESYRNKNSINLRSWRKKVLTNGSRGHSE